MLLPCDRSLGLTKEACARSSATVLDGHFTDTACFSALAQALHFCEGDGMSKRIESSHQLYFHSTSAPRRRLSFSCRTARSLLLRAAPALASPAPAAPRRASSDKRDGGVRHRRTFCSISTAPVALSCAQR